MGTLSILRHAKAEQADGRTADHERRLTARGRDDAARIGHLVAELAMAPDAVYSSTAVRAFETAEIFAASCGYAGAIGKVPELYLADTDDCIAVLAVRAGTARHVAIVGHNPTLEDLVRVLTGATVQLSTAALARIDLPIRHWNELTNDTSGTLAGMWRPKELREHG